MSYICPVFKYDMEVDELADEVKDLRRLVIKAFHMTDVEWGEENDITVDGHMTVSKAMLESLTAKEDHIEKIDIQIIRPGDHDRWTNTIMDIIPISTKVLGKLGEGITHTVTGVYVMLTGVDTNGKQCHEFGSSEGNLKEQLYLNRAGTPGDDDYIISFDVTLVAGMGQEGPGPQRRTARVTNLSKATEKSLRNLKATSVRSVMNIMILCVLARSAY